MAASGSIEGGGGSGSGGPNASLLAGLPSTLATNARVWLLSLPLLTRLLLCGLPLVHLCTLSAWTPIVRLFCLQPSRVLAGFQVHRIVTHSLIHGNWLHVATNCLCWLSVARDLERHLGTTALAYSVFLFSVVTALLHCTAAVVLYMTMLALHTFTDTCTIGFSGVLFALVTAHVYKYSTQTAIKLYGGLVLPTTVYPWFLLVLAQFIMPQVSFLGHLSGIIVGLSYIHGFLDPVCPTTATVRGWEGTKLVGWFRTLPGFVSCPDVKRLPVAQAGGRFKMPGQPRTTRQHWVRSLYATADRTLSRLNLGASLSTGTTSELESGTCSASSVLSASAASDSSDEMASLSTAAAGGGFESPLRPSRPPSSVSASHPPEAVLDTPTALLTGGTGSSASPLPTKPSGHKRRPSREETVIAKGMD